MVTTAIPTEPLHCKAEIPALNNTDSHTKDASGTQPPAGAAVPDISRQVIEIFRDDLENAIKKAVIGEKDRKDANGTQLPAGAAAPDISREVIEIFRDVLEEARKKAMEKIKGDWYLA